MAIDRGPWNALVDDDGSNLVGSLWNKAAIKTVLLDPIDAAFSTPTVAPWTPIDASGAGLVLTVQQANYCRIGRLVAVWCTFSYPANSNGVAAVTGGLPFVIAATSGLYTTYGTSQIAHLGAARYDIQFFDLMNGAARTNAQLSGAFVSLAGLYLTY